MTAETSGKQLFAVYVGGEAKGANIELHDMRFVAADRLEDTYESLRAQWWGIPESLHVDAWSAITQADGHRVTLRPTPPANSENKLYYVNVGGYDPAQFTEQHQNIFVVAPTASKAKVRALKLVRHWDAFHKDDLYEAEQCFSLDQTAADGKLYIHLEPIEDQSPAPFTCYYKQIGRKQAA